MLNGSHTQPPLFPPPCKQKFLYRPYRILAPESSGPPIDFARESAIIEVSEVAEMGRILAGAGIVVNLFAPGIGSLIMGKWSSGAIQTVVLLLVGLLKLISISFIGWFTMPVAGGLYGIIWVWALVGGIMTFVARGHQDAIQHPRY